MTLQPQSVPNQTRQKKTTQILGPAALKAIEQKEGCMSTIDPSIMDARDTKMRVPECFDCKYTFLYYATRHTRIIIAIILHCWRCHVTCTTIETAVSVWLGEYRYGKTILVGFNEDISWRFSHLGMAKKEENEIKWRCKIWRWWCVGNVAIVELLLSHWIFFWSGTAFIILLDLLYTPPPPRGVNKWR